jgi:hypothetical protein
MAGFCEVLTSLYAGRQLVGNIIELQPRQTTEYCLLLMNI